MHNTGKITTRKDQSFGQNLEVFTAFRCSEMENIAGGKGREVEGDRGHPGRRNHTGKM